MEVVLGTAQLTREYGITSRQNPAPKESSPRELLKSAEELGCIAIDTAPVYGAAEFEIGEAGTKLPLHSKLDPAVPAGESIRNSLKNLQRDYLDILYYHQGLTSSEVDTIDTEVRLSLDSGAVRRLGVSVYELAELGPLESARSITAIQAPFSVLDRRFTSDLFAGFVGRGGKVYIRSLFLQGLLLSRTQSVPPSVNSLTPFLREFWRICDEWEVDPIDGAMQFVHRELPFAGFVVGARNVEELTRIMRAREVRIDEGYFRALKEMDLPPWDTVDPRKW